MSLPLPKVVPDVGPGGGLLNALNAINSFADNSHKRRYNQVKADWANTTIPAQAMSQLAYANAVGPQFIAKLMQNPAFIAQLSEEQKKNLKEMEYTFGNAAGKRSIENINNLNNMPHSSGISSQPGTNSKSGLLWDGLKNALGLRANNQQQSQNPLNQNPMQQPIPQNGRISPNGMNMELNTDMRGQKQTLPSNANLVNDDHVMAGYEIWAETPKGQKELAQAKAEGRQPNLPTEEEARELAMPTQQQREKTWAEKAGEQQGIIKEGEEAGKIRATSRKELDQEYQQALQLKQPLQKINSIVSQPRFQRILNIPGFQKLSMKAAANFGTKEDQKLIGEFLSARQNVVAATVKGFGGRILASEIPLSESMKLNDKDSIGVILGKAPVITEFNEFTLQRSRMASKLMKEYHLDKGEALEQADKLIDGDDIRRKIANELESEITEDDIKETITAHPEMTRDQIIKRLKDEGRKYNG